MRLRYEELENCQTAVMTIVATEKPLFVLSVTRKEDANNLFALCLSLASDMYGCTIEVEHAGVRKIY